MGAVTAGVEELLFMRAKRFESSEKVLFAVAAVGCGERVLWECSFDQGFEVSLVDEVFFPMPRPGTEIPVLPSLLMAEVFRPPLVDGACCGRGTTASYVGGEETGEAMPAEFWRAGNLGGRPGLGFAGCAASSCGGDAIFLCTGGGGRWLVCSPVLSAR